VRGNGVYALWSDMCALDFVMEPLFECINDDDGGAAFFYATRSIGGWDATEEYMAWRLFPLLDSFGLREIEDGERPVSKITLPLPEFPVARFPEETDDHFRARVELAIENVLGSYASGEHDACIAAVPNEGRLNQVFEQADVPYGARLEPGSEASKEAAKKRKNDRCRCRTGKKTCEGVRPEGGGSEGSCSTKRHRCNFVERCFFSYEINAKG
jgi:hypothetical protein